MGESRGRPGGPGDARWRPLANALVSTTLSTAALRDVPDWIGALAAGRPASAAAARAASVSPPGFVGYGLAFGVACSEWVPYEPASAILPAARRAFPRYPQSVLAQPPQFTYMTDDCRVWTSPRPLPSSAPSPPARSRRSSSAGRSTPSRRCGGVRSPRSPSRRRRSRASRASGTSWCRRRAARSAS